MAFKTSSFNWQYGGSLLSYGVGDFNGDGVLDFAFGGPATPFRDETRPFKIISIDQNGVIADTTNTIMVSVPVATHPREMFIADFNGDGVDDFFSANHGYDAQPFPGERNTLMLSSGGRLVDASSTLPPYSHFTHSVTGGDINNDGSVDLFIGVLGWNWDNEIGSYFLMNDGKGHFSQGDVPPKLIDGTQLEGRFTASHLVDINSDGWLDLVVGTEENGVTAGLSYLNDGTGHFSEASQSLLPVGLYGQNNSPVMDIIDFDINGDGHTDLVLNETAGNPSYQGQKLQILINDGSGHFRDETASRITQDGVGYWNQNIKAIDFNSDGFTDLLAQNDFGRPSEQTVLWLNNGHGVFNPVPGSVLDGFEGGIVPLDFNRDGRMDYLSFDREGGWNGTGKWRFNTHLNMAEDLLFDEVFYSTFNPDVVRAGIDAREHFFRDGWREGRDPNSLFDTDSYLAHNADVAAAGINPFEHYLQSGWREGRDPSPAFDTASYLAAYADVAASGLNPLHHYLNWGAAEGRSAFGDNSWL